MVKSTQVGSVELVTLGIGSAERSLDQVHEIFPGVGHEELRREIAAACGGDGSMMQWDFNAALVRIGGRRVLVDTGFGFSDGGPGTGTEQLLEEAGTDAGEIDTIVITHGHGDHIGGLLEDGRLAFSNAQLCLSRREAEVYTKGSGPQAEALRAYRDKTVLVDDGELVADAPDGSELRVVAAPGHTVGHVGLDIRSAGARLRLLVDTVHTLFQLRRPEWSPRYDSDPGLAALTRRTLLAEAAEEKIPVLVYHFPFPAVGRLYREQAGFRFDPLP